MDNIMTGIVFFQKGGLIMYVLLLCSLFVVAYRSGEAAVLPEAGFRPLICPRLP
ncbi:MAG: hypothetical protein LKE51_06745 [Selenomonas sp.]|nr:hypothetical protein [Selenomonas sp.]